MVEGGDIIVMASGLGGMLVGGILGMGLRATGDGLIISLPPLIADEDLSPY